MHEIQKTDINNILKPRELDSHKGDFGKVLLVAGSTGMAGAAVLAARGAYLSGAGLVVCALPDRLFPILQIALPEAVCIPRKTGKINCPLYDAIILGPGLGTLRENASLIEEILLSYGGPLVIDADGLNCIEQFDLYQALLDTMAQVVITPHPGEAKRLLGVCEIQDRESFAVSLAQTFRVTAVLNGAGTLIAAIDQNGTPILNKNTTGNPGMATAGSGDVLSGIIGGFLAQGHSTLDASIAGVYIHGSAGDMAATEVGEAGLIASDICRHIPYAIKNITGK